MRLLTKDEKEIGCKGFLVDNPVVDSFSIVVLSLLSIVVALSPFILWVLYNNVYWLVLYIITGAAYLLTVFIKFENQTKGGNK